MMFDTEELERRYDRWLDGIGKLVCEPRMDGSHRHTAAGFKAAKTLAWRFIEREICEKDKQG